jgi:hypothetical protein
MTSGSRPVSVVPGGRNSLPSMIVRGISAGADTA